MNEIELKTVAYRVLAKARASQLIAVDQSILDVDKIYEFLVPMLADSKTPRIPDVETIATYYIVASNLSTTLDKLNNKPSTTSTTVSKLTKAFKEVIDNGNYTVFNRDEITDEEITTHCSKLLSSSNLPTILNNLKPLVVEFITNHNANIKAKHK